MDLFKRKNMDSVKNKTIGYPMVFKLINKLDENQDYTFDFEPGQIIQELFESYQVLDTNFTNRMVSDHEFTGNKLFTQMRKSIRELKQK